MAHPILPFRSSPPVSLPPVDVNRPPPVDSPLFKVPHTLYAVSEREPCTVVEVLVSNGEVTEGRTLFEVQGNEEAQKLSDILNFFSAQQRMLIHLIQDGNPSVRDYLDTGTLILNAPDIS